jgi:HEAT repeat protein
MGIVPGSSHHRRRDLKDLSAQGQAAAEWFRKLANALKTSRLYTPDNVVVKQVREELVADLTQHLNYHGNWRLFFSTDHIHLENEAVVRPSPVDPDLGVPLVRAPEEVLPYLFYRDGIRTMILKKGLGRREIDVLFDALRIVGASAAGNDDLVTLLWQANLRDIQIESVPLEQAIYLSAKAVRKKSAGAATKGLAFAWAPSGGEIRAELGQGSGSQGLHRDTFDDWPLPEVHAQAVNAYRALLPVIEPLRAGMLADWENERTRDWTEEAPGVLRQILELDPREETRRGLAHSVVSWLLNALRTCAWAEASQALALLQEFDPDLSRVGTELDEGLADLPEDEIYGRLDEAEPGEHAAFSALVVALGERAQALAFGVLASCTRMRPRAAAAAALSYVYADDPKKLAPQLDSPHWYVVRNVVFVLGQIGGSGVVDMLRTAALHHEPRVKRAVVQAVGGVSRAERTPILMSLLQTRDSQLFAAVLTMLTREKNARVTRALFDRAASPEFGELSEVNQRALWNALFEVADEELIEPLEQLLTRGPWLTRPSLAGIGAARALRRVGSDRAIAALEAGLRSRNEAVSAACLDALSGPSTL